MWTSVFINVTCPLFQILYGIYWDSEFERAESWIYGKTGMHVYLMFLINPSALKIYCFRFVMFHVVMDTLRTCCFNLVGLCIVISRGSRVVKMLVSKLVHCTWVLLASVSAWMGDHQGRPCTVNLRLYCHDRAGGRKMKLPNIWWTNKCVNLKCTMSSTVQTSKPSKWHVYWKALVKFDTSLFSTSTV